ncbi:MAG: cupin domain-containing protein [Gammaproteobacteria bacterium]|nr:cupin domain-containing protein [Gammaproteobacteria bacterium]
MRDYWQRRPLLVRAAFTPFRSPVDRDRLLRLAQRDDVESRIVQRSGRRWRLDHGPFTRRELPPLKQKRWTLLVQGIDGLDRNAQALLARFRFLADARLDDLMASYATDGGSVGPHVDQYDVFLLQASGRRRWRISRQRDQSIDRRQPLKLLQDFRPTQEWLLEPGDMLYLPPGVAHEGAAEGECITLSIGFRAAVWQELLDPWFAHFAETVSLPGRFRDPGVRETTRPGRLAPALLGEAHRRLSRRRPRRADTERFLLEYLSEPKGQTRFRPRPEDRAAGFRREARRHGLRLDGRSRLLYGADSAAINGEIVPVPLTPLLRQLADQRSLSAKQFARAPESLRAVLADWYRAGWIAIDR